MANVGCLRRNTRAQRVLLGSFQKQVDHRRIDAHRELRRDGEGDGGQISTVRDTSRRGEEAKGWEGVEGEEGRKGERKQGGRALGMAYGRVGRTDG